MDGVDGLAAVMDRNPAHKAVEHRPNLWTGYRMGNLATPASMQMDRSSFRHQDVKDRSLASPPPQEHSDDSTGPEQACVAPFEAAPKCDGEETFVPRSLTMNFDPDGQQCLPGY